VLQLALRLGLDASGLIVPLLGHAIPCLFFDEEADGVGVSAGVVDDGLARLLVAPRPAALLLERVQGLRQLQRKTQRKRES
jgi:hypothetical protein